MTMEEIIARFAFGLGLFVLLAAVVGAVVKLAPLGDLPLSVGACVFVVCLLAALAMGAV